MITLAHISDIHLSPMPHIAWSDLVGKRITGFLNWKLKRNEELNSETLANLVAHLKAQGADFTAVTGDLVNLALDVEMDRAARWLEALGPADKIAVCPGNHDAYVPGALEVAQRAWGDYMTGETLDDDVFPFVRRIGELAVISCSSAVPTRPFLAVGRFDEKQAERLAKILKTLGEADYFRTVLIHHPPNPELQHPSFGLKGNRLFRHRCSYMIYSPVFNGLPPEMKSRVFTSLKKALAPETTEGDYAYLSLEEKAAIRARSGAQDDK